MLYYNNISLQSRLIQYIESSGELTIFCAYIKLAKLKELLKNTVNCNRIIVRWTIEDLVRGASDLEVYSYCKEKGISLFRNTRLHQKVFLDISENRCLLTTANISDRALSLKENDYNYEIGSVIENLSFKDRLYFEEIVNSSQLIDDSVYHSIKKHIEKIPNPVILPIEEIDLGIKEVNQDKAFLLSALPMSFNVAKLWDCSQHPDEYQKIDYECAIHDLILYRIPFGITYNEFRERLKQNFFQQPFIKAFLQLIEDNDSIVCFGAVRRWLANTCADVPIPRAWDVTENVQILYRWIEDLSEGKYVVEVPGKRSECIKKQFTSSSKS